MWLSLQKHLSRCGIIIIYCRSLVFNWHIQLSNLVGLEKCFDLVTACHKVPHAIDFSEVKNDLLVCECLSETNGCLCCLYWIWYQPGCLVTYCLLLWQLAAGSTDVSAGVSLSCACLQHWPLAEQIHLCSATVVGDMREQRFLSTQWQSDPMLSLD